MVMSDTVLPNHKKTFPGRVHQICALQN